MAEWERTTYPDTPFYQPESLTGFSPREQSEYESNIQQSMSEGLTREEAMRLYNLEFGTP